MDPNTRIDTLVQRRRQLDAKIEKLLARQKAATRKQRTRALILLGAAIEAELKASPESLSTVMQVVSERLSALRDREAVLAHLNSVNKEANQWRP